MQAQLKPYLLDTQEISSSPQTVLQKVSRNLSSANSFDAFPTLLLLTYFWKWYNMQTDQWFLQSCMSMRNKKEKKEKCSRGAEGPISELRRSLSPCLSVTGTSVEILWILILSFSFLFPLQYFSTLVMSQCMEPWNWVTIHRQSYLLRCNNEWIWDVDNSADLTGSGRLLDTLTEHSKIKFLQISTCFIFHNGQHF